MNDRQYKPTLIDRTDWYDDPVTFWDRVGCAAIGLLAAAIVWVLWWIAA